MFNRYNILIKTCTFFIRYKLLEFIFITNHDPNQYINLFTKVLYACGVSQHNRWCGTMIDYILL